MRPAREVGEIVLIARIQCRSVVDVVDAVIGSAVVQVGSSVFAILELFVVVQKRVIPGIALREDKWQVFDKAITVILFEPLEETIRPPDGGQDLKAIFPS